MLFSLVCTPCCTQEKHQSLYLCIRGTSSWLQHHAPGQGLWALGISSSETRVCRGSNSNHSALGYKPSSDICSGVDKPLGINLIFIFLATWSVFLFFFFLSFINSCGLDFLLSKGFLVHRTSSWGRQKSGYGRKTFWLIFQISN